MHVEASCRSRIDGRRVSLHQSVTPVGIERNPWGADRGESWCLHMLYLAVARPSTRKPTLVWTSIGTLNYLLTGSLPTMVGI